jgi:hypothetical protein
MMISNDKECGGKKAKTTQIHMQSTACHCKFGGRLKVSAVMALYVSQHTAPLTYRSMSAQGSLSFLASMAVQYADQ